MEILQNVTSGATKDNQKVRFPLRTAWWTVKGRDKTWVILQRGTRTIRVDHDCKLLQELFANF